MYKPGETPLFPLGGVVFPGGELSLRIFEPRYVQMTRQCLVTQQGFGVVLIRGGYEVGLPAVPYDVGCLAQITECQEVAKDRFAMTVRGTVPFRIIERRLTAEGLMLGQLELIEPADPTPLPAVYEPMQALLRDLVQRYGPKVLPQPWRWEDADWVSYRLAEVMPWVPERKQRLLQVNNPLQRLETIERYMKEADSSR